MQISNRYLNFHLTLSNYTTVTLLLPTTIHTLHFCSYTRKQNGLRKKLMLYSTFSAKRLSVPLTIMQNRVVQNFKCQKFIPDLANYYSLGQKHSKNAKILKIEQCLDMPISDQSFSIKHTYVNQSYQENSIFFNFFILSTCIFLRS